MSLKALSSLFSRNGNIVKVRVCDDDEDDASITRWVEFKNWPIEFFALVTQQGPFFHSNSLTRVTFTVDLKCVLSQIPIRSLSEVKLFFVELL